MLKIQNSDKVKSVLYLDNTWDKSQFLVRYNVEAVFDNKVKTISKKVRYINNF